MLLTLGRLPKALDLARCMSAAGWRVLVAEPGRRHLCGSSRYVERSFQVPAPVSQPDEYLAELSAIIKREGVDLVLPVSEEILHVAALHGRLDPGVTIASMTLDELLSVHGKLSFIQACQRLGIAAPTTYRLNDARAKSLSRDTDVIIKREFSCAGVGMESVAAGEPLPVREQPAEWLVQQRLEGTEISSFTIAWQGRSLATVVYRGTVMSGTVSVCFERIDPDPRMLRWVENFIEGTGVSGFIGLDLMVAESGQVYGLECNPRATSGVHFFDPQDLASALIDPANCDKLQFRSRRLYQQFYPCLTETQASLFRRHDFIHNLGQLVRARDVSFQLNDPLPFLLLPFTAWPILSKTLFSNMSFGEAATWDIEWTAPGRLTP